MMKQLTGWVCNLMHVRDYLLHFEFLSAGTSSDKQELDQLFHGILLEICLTGLYDCLLETNEQ